MEIKKKQKQKENRMSVNILESLQRTPHSPLHDSVCLGHLERNWSYCNRSVQNDRESMSIYNMVNRTNTTTTNKIYKWCDSLLYYLRTSVCTYFHFVVMMYCI